MEAGTNAMAPAAGGLAGEIEVEAYRRLFPLAFYERHLREAVRPDARRLAEARHTTVTLGAVCTAHGSALVKLGNTTMLASIKLEVMTPTADSPDQGSIAVDFHMPPICSQLVRPGRPAEVAPVISKALEDVIMSSGMINLKEFCLICGKASWLAYLDVCCLNADGSLFDAALVSAVAAFTNLEIPLVSVSDDGRVFTVGGNEGKTKFELVNREKRKLNLNDLPFSLTCVLHKENVLADPTAEEESIMETFVTIVLDSSDHLVLIYKPGGGVISIAIIKECIRLTKGRSRELREILMDSVQAIEVDQP